MKTSSVIAVLILAAATVLNWHADQQLAKAGETHAKLIIQGTQPNRTLSPALPIHPGEDNGQAEARLAAAELFAFAGDMEVIKNEGRQPDPSLQKRILDTMRRIMTMNPAQLRILISETFANTDLTAKTRLGMLHTFLTQLGKKNPHDALAILIKSRAVLTEEARPAGIIATALASWFGTDPVSATGWVRENDGKFPGLITEAAKLGILASTAARDPKAAFGLIGELNFQDPKHGIQEIIQVSTTDKQRTATLTALRGHLAGLTDETTRAGISSAAVKTLARGLAQGGFAPASVWIASTPLTAEELESFAGGLVSNVKTEETGQWIQWLCGNLPAGKADDTMDKLLTAWTEQDHAAAGKWLNAMPQSPAKNVAISAFAEAVSKYEPEAALRWAFTLPQGEARDTLLKQIHATQSIGKTPNH